MIRWINPCAFLKIANITWTRQFGCKLSDQINSLTSAPSIASTRKFQSSLRDKKLPEASLESSYTNEQKEIILRVLNNSTIDDLCAYDVIKRRATNLVRHRQRKKEFTQLDDILEADGFGLDHFRSLCDSIVYGLSEDSKKRHRSTWQKVCTPTVSNDLKMNLTSVVSMRIFQHEVFWLHLGRDMTLLDWELMDLEKVSTCNYKSSLERVHIIIQRLPKADAYIMEQRYFRGKQTVLSPALLGIVQMESMLTALLNADFASTGRHRVFSIKELMVGRFFSLKVGNENVSSQNVVSDILNGSHGMDLRKVKVDPGQRLWYQKHEPATREELANLLLQAIAFYEMEIIRAVV